jgi:hypothetical protein
MCSRTGTPEQRKPKGGAGSNRTFIPPPMSEKARPFSRPPSIRPPPPSQTPPAGHDGAYLRDGYVEAVFQWLCSVGAERAVQLRRDLEDAAAGGWPLTPGHELAAKFELVCLYAPRSPAREEPSPFE